MLKSHLPLTPQTYKNVLQIDYATEYKTMQLIEKSTGEKIFITLG